MLRQYIEFVVMFSQMDDNGEGKISLGEFKDALPELKKWGCIIDEL